MKIHDIPRVQLFIGGCTGSNVSPLERFSRSEEDGQISRPLYRARFGVHTTSLVVIVGNTAYLIDHGAGAGQSAEFIKSAGVKSIVMLFTHWHHDHICGLMLDPYVLDKTGIVRAMYGPSLGEWDTAKVLGLYYAPPFWPIGPKMFGVGYETHSFAPGETLPGNIRTMLLNHSGGAVAYRIPTPQGDIAIATDNELSNPDIQKRTAEFLAGAEVAYVDVQYRDAEYSGDGIIGSGSTKVERKGYGHSTPSMLAETYSYMLEAPKLTLVGHHDPKRSDDDLQAFELEIKRNLRHLGAQVRLARECEIVNLERLTPHVVFESAFA